MICPNYIPFVGYKETMSSLCEPDQSLSVQEIISRFTAGREVPSSNGYFDECDDSEFESDPTRVPGFEFSDAFDLASDLASELERSEGQTSDNVVEPEQATSDAKEDE